jgi:hypothetical protein
MRLEHAALALAIAGTACKSYDVLGNPTTEPEGGFMRPIEDISTGGYEPSTGTTLWENLDEESSDGDVTHAFTATSGSAVRRFRVLLSSLGSDWDPGLPAVIRVTARRQGQDVMEQKIRLYQGTSLIAEGDFANLADTYSVQGLTLSASQRASVTDPSNLRVEVEAVLSALLEDAEHRVSHVELFNGE